MEIIAADAKYYKSVMSSVPHAFNSVAFNQLNESKCDKLHYLLFKSDRFRLGLIAGQKENRLLSPFSAPYGGFSWAGESVGVTDFLEACALLLNYAAAENMQEVCVTLPPAIYGNANIAKSVYAFQRAGFELAFIDLNHYLLLAEIGPEYDVHISSNTRRNLRLAAEANLRLKHCTVPAEYEQAYAVIAVNRKEQELPLKLSYDEVIAATTIIPADFFLVFAGEHPIAAAIVFRVTKKVVQLIYWGDLAAFRPMKPMNFLARELVSFYCRKRVQVLDLGISTDKGAPNTGLCEFKESVGCEVVPKFSFIARVERG
jgi:hypothetical protein